MVGVIRIELMTSSMSTKRSTTELHAQSYLKPYFLREFKDKNYYISLKFLINSFNKSPLKVSFFLFKIFKKKMLQFIN